jgi:hypothetical protein
MVNWRGDSRMPRGKIEIATTEECPKNYQSAYSEFWVKKETAIF